MTRSTLPARAIALPVLALATALALGPLPARADVIQPPVFQDTVSLTLMAEAWVKTETALVALVVDVAGGAADAAQLRPQILKAANAVAPNADWRFVRLDRRADDAGLDRWQAVLEARLPESALGGLSEAAKKVSRPGQQVRVGMVAFDPTLEEVEATRSSLRANLYAQADAELKRLNAAFPDRGYRVTGIDFFEQEDGVPAPEIKMRGAMAAEMAMGGGGSGGGVQEKLVLTARVMLGASHVPEVPVVRIAPQP